MSAALEVTATPAVQGPAAVPACNGERETRALLSDLDDEIISMVLRRVELARYGQSLRQLSGLPVSELAWENGVLGRYSDALGRQGADIGRAVLALAQLLPAYRPTQRGSPKPD